MCGARKNPMTETLDDRHAIGANNPPLTPYEKAKAAVDEIYEQAEQWLDGDPIDSDLMAEGVAKLQKLIKAEKKAAEDARKAEVKPHDDAKKEIQGRYNPLKERCDLAIQVCNDVLTPWMQKKAAIAEAEAKAKRDEADRKRIEAEKAIREADAANVIEKAKAEALVKDAKKADGAANRAAKVTGAPKADGRAVTFRTYWTATMVDGQAAARYYWPIRTPNFNNLLQTLADEDVRAGQHEIPGFEITSEKRAV